MMLKTTTSAAAIAALFAWGAAAQTTGQATDDAVEETGEALNATGEAAEQVGEDIAQEAGEAAEATGQALENAGDAVVQETEEAGDAIAEGAEEVEAEVQTETIAIEPAEGDAQAGDSEAVVVEGEAVDAETVVVEGETTEVEPVEGEAIDAETVVVEGEAAEAEVPEGTPVEGQLFEQSADSFLASSLLGTNVISTTGEDVGEVDDMVLGADGSIEGVVVGVGGFLGLGERNVAVEFGTIQVQQDPDTGALAFVLNATEEELEAAPEFRTRDDIEAEEAAEQPIGTAPAEDGVLVDPNAPATD